MEHSIPPVQSLFDFSNKVVIVTGSGSGLGQGIARRFAEAGARVVVHYHTSADGARVLVNELRARGSDALAVQANLVEPNDAARLVEETVRARERVDVLVNNVGIYPAHALLEISAAQWNEVVEANLRSVFFCTQAFAKQIIKQKSGGAIVNITSIEAENPALAHPHYDAAKGGVWMLTRAAALELAAYAIRVNAVAPGLIWRQGIETNWRAGVARWRKAAPLKRLGLPEDVADACLFLASPAARWITGAQLVVDGGVTCRSVY